MRIKTMFFLVVVIPSCFFQIKLLHSSEHSETQKPIPTLKKLCIKEILKNYNLRKQVHRTPMELFTEIIKKEMKNQGIQKYMQQECVATLSKHTSMVTSLHTIETDGGSRLISGSQNGMIYIWDLNHPTCPVIAAYLGHTKHITGITSLYRNNEWEIFSGSEDFTVQKWSLLGEQKLVYPHTSSIRSLGILVDTCKPAIFTADDCVINVWNLENNTLQEQIHPNLDNEKIVSVNAVNANNELKFCIASSDGKINVYDVQKKTKRPILKTTYDSIVYFGKTYLVRKKNGFQFLAIAYGMNNNPEEPQDFLFVWDNDISKDPYLYNIDLGGYTALHIVDSQDSLDYLAGNPDGNLWSYDKKSKKVITCKPHLENFELINSINKSTKGDIIAGYTGGTIRLWNLAKQWKKLDTIDYKKAEKIWEKLQNNEPTAKAQQKKTWESIKMILENNSES